MIVITIYTILIVSFIFGLTKLPEITIDKQLSQLKFSIVIPFRNEEKSLENLLKSIIQLDYSSNYFEILFVDDESTDNSVNIIKRYQSTSHNIHLLSNVRTSNSPKKDAIQVGIKASQFDWILTTDADCILPENWLLAYNSIIHKKESLFIAGAIQLKTENSFVHQYQKLDTLSLLGSTMGTFGIKAPIMCNAANMGFHKKTYLQIHNNNNITSGDDVFTLESFIKHFPEKVHYLNTLDAIVTTKAEESWKAIIQQRIRWAAKSTHYKSLFAKVIGLIVLITQLTLVLGLILIPKTIVFIWLLKIAIDFILIKTTAHKTNQPVNILEYLKVAIIYPFLNTYIGIRSLFGSYTWKNRIFKK